MIFNRFAFTQLRELKHLSKSDISRDAKRAASYVTELEKGDKARPTIETLKRLADVMDVDVRALYVSPSIDVLVDELVERLNGDAASFDSVIARLASARARDVA